VQIKIYAEYMYICLLLIFIKIIFEDGCLPILNQINFSI